MERLISELLDLPDQVHQGDFVLNLSEGVTRAGRADAGRLRRHPPARRRLRQRPGLHPGRPSTTGAARPPTSMAASAPASRTSWPSSTCSSSTTPGPGRHEGLEAVCVKQDWVQGKKFLLVPYHMIDARSMEAAILGGYADHVRRDHPEAPWPGVYLADDLFDDARRYRANDGRRGVLRPARPATADGRSGASGPPPGTPHRFEAGDGRPARRRVARPARRRPGQAPVPGATAGASRRGKTESFLVAGQGPERHQPAREGRSATTA